MQLTMTPTFSHTVYRWAFSHSVVVLLQLGAVQPKAMRLCEKHKTLYIGWTYRRRRCTRIQPIVVVYRPKNISVVASVLYLMRSGTLVGIVARIVTVTEQLGYRKTGQIGTIRPRALEPHP